MTISNKKNILCLESLWNDEVEEKTSVLPLLELTEKTSRIEFAHLSCNTLGEFKHNLELVPRKKAYKILYLAFHGGPGTICFPDENVFSLDELAGIMKNRFDGWVLHFGSCSTLRVSESEIKRFMDSTGVSLVCGYTKVINWIDSAALDLLLFRGLQNYKYPKSFVNYVERTYPDLVKLNGFRAVHKAVK